MTKTPIETLANALSGFRYIDAEGECDSLAAGDVLVPEQCMILYISGRPYHLTVEPMPE